MKKFYTVDRVGALREGLVVDLVRHSDVEPACLQDHVNELYPDGLSAHGERYLLKPDSRGNIASPIIELLFENIRRAHYPGCPSRFQSFFACSSIEEARQFRKAYGTENSPIWAIDTTNQYFKGNMRLLDNNQTNLICSYIAHEYWKGNQGPIELQGLNEVVISLPITIGCRVE